MKFNPTWTQVALIIALLASVVGSHLWAPAAVAVITSLVSTIIGSLFVNLKEKGNEEMVSNVITAVMNSTGQFKRVESNTKDGTVSGEVRKDFPSTALPDSAPPPNVFGNPEPFSEIQDKKENKP